MQKKQMLLPLLLVLLFSAGFGYAAAGNVNTLCSSISDDLSTAGGCIDDNDLEDTITSSGGLFVLETGDKSGLLMLFIVIGIIVSVTAGAIIAIKLSARR